MKLTKNAVAEWFMAHTYSVVGFREQGDSCPLATYIDDTHPLLIDVSVGPDTLMYRNKRTGEWKEVPLPDWAKRFVFEVDYAHDVVDYEIADYSYEEWDPIAEDTYIVEDYEEIPVYNDEVYGDEAYNVLRQVTNYSV